MCCVQQPNGIYGKLYVPPIKNPSKDSCQIEHLISSSLWSYPRIFGVSMSKGWTRHSTHWIQTKKDNGNNDMGIRSPNSNFPSYFQQSCIDARWLLLPIFRSSWQIKTPFGPSSCGQWRSRWGFWILPFNIPSAWGFVSIEHLICSSPRC